MSEQQSKQNREAGTVRNNKRVATGAALFACAMLGLAFASVPLYRVFCQATGFAGTTQRAVKAPGAVNDRAVVVRFDSNVATGLAWTFKPVQSTIKVRLGENTLAFYRATNNSDHDITGTATFNVAPEAAGAYFNKIACFCFTEQTLKPGETVEMPVSFFVDPDIVKDRTARSITQITLSYTFYPAAKAKQAASTDKRGSRLQ